VVIPLILTSTPIEVTVSFYYCRHLTFVCVPYSIYFFQKFNFRIMF
jgi:hypothetical protein